MDSKKENNKRLKLFNYYDTNKDKWSDSNPGNKLIAEERKITLKEILKKHNLNLADKKILEVGSGAGTVMSLLIKLGAVENNLYGVDIRDEKIKICKDFFPKANVYKMDAREITFEDNYFDIIVTFTLFSSIKNDGSRKIVSEQITRLLKPNGTIIYYDFRYSNPLNRIVSGVSFQEIKDMFPNFQIDLALITLFPFLSRKICSVFPSFYVHLKKIKFLKSHLIGVLKNIN